MKSTEALFEAVYPKDGMLVIGLVAQVGTNLDDLCAAIETRLKNKNYEVVQIKLSELLQQKGTGTKDKQDQGTKLREALQCQHALALCAIAKIWHTHRESEPRNHKAYILRSLKRPEEVEALRIIYGEAFIPIGVHTPKNKRLHYLKDVKGDSSPLETIKCDENATNYFGQRTRDTFEFCDVFIKGLDPEYAGLDRALKLCFGSVFTTPTIDEYAMAMAYAASLRSADLSRQVGASVVNASKEVVAVGANEVPRFGGGQPWPEDRPDLRDFAEMKKDPNVSERDRLITELLTSLSEHLSDDENQKPLNLADEKIRGLVKRSGLFDITEFGRTVHAEMACLMSCLRNHVEVKGGTLYSTTFPCHNCLRHILAAGVKEVVYVEPYPKSRAEVLFDKSCFFWDASFDAETGEARKTANALYVKPFIGIGPRRFHDLFAMRTVSGRRIERKDEHTGSAKTETTKDLQDLKWPSSHFGLTPREAKAVQQLVSLWDAKYDKEFVEVAALIGVVKEGSKSIPEERAWRNHVDTDPDKTISPAAGVQTKNAATTSSKGASRRVQPKVRTKGKSPQGPMVNVQQGGVSGRKEKPNSA